MAGMLSLKLLRATVSSRFDKLAVFLGLIRAYLDNSKYLYSSSKFHIFPAQVFALCGGHVSPVLTGCASAGIRVIDTRHEASSAFAADAAARLSGIPGVCVVTAGPGLTNTVTAVKNAQMAETPLIVIGGAAPTLLKGRGTVIYPRSNRAHY